MVLLRVACAFCLVCSKGSRALVPFPKVQSIKEGAFSIQYLMKMEGNTMKKDYRMFLNF